MHYFWLSEIHKTMHRFFHYFYHLGSYPPADYHCVFHLLGVIGAVAALVAVAVPHTVDRPCEAEAARGQALGADNEGRYPLLFKHCGCLIARGWRQGLMTRAIINVQVVGGVSGPPPPPLCFGWGPPTLLAGHQCLGGGTATFYFIFGCS